MSWNIITDSASDLAFGMECAPEVVFSTVPLKIMIDGKEYVDNAALDVREMMTAMEQYQGASSSACPAPEEWAEKFRAADYSIAITMTSALSGTYNSACVARDMVLEEMPEKKIHVLDTKATAGPSELIARKVNEWIAQGKSFEEVVQLANEFAVNCKLLFTLSSFENLIKNGRMNRFVGMVAAALNIRPVGCASSKGELAILHKPRGEARAITVLVEEMGRMKDMTDANVIISHCFNSNGALLVKKLIEKTYPGANVKISATRGLNSYYAERSGLLVAF